MSDDDRRVLAAVHDDLAALTFNDRAGMISLGQVISGIVAIQMSIRAHLKAAARDD